MLPVSGAEQLKTSEREVHAAHDLGERRVLEVGEAGAVLALGQEEVPEPGGLGLLLQLLDDAASAASGRPR